MSVPIAWWVLKESSDAYRDYGLLPGRIPKKFLRKAVEGSYVRGGFTDDQPLVTGEWCRSGDSNPDERTPTAP
jgi:hypothetical protein